MQIVKKGTALLLAVLLLCALTLSGCGAAKIEAGDYTGSVRFNHPMELESAGMDGTATVETVEDWGMDVVITVDEDGIIWNISYTTFSQEWDGEPTYDEAAGTLTFPVKVTNTGSVASKTVVELYCEQPYTAGGVEKAKVVLVGYDKTSTLEPGASETVTITVNKDELASYDYKNEGCYVLDAGSYTFYSELGANGSHCWAAQDGSVLSQSFELAGEVYDESNPRSTDQVAVVNQFDDVTAGDGSYSADDYMTRAPTRSASRTPPLNTAMCSPAPAAS